MTIWISGTGRLLKSVSNSTPSQPSAEGSDGIVLGFTPIQRVGALLIGILLLLMGYQVVQLAAERESTLRSIVDSDDVTGNVFFTQRESLVLVVDVERWMSGLETKRNVLIRRALLAQRLNVRDSDGVTNGERAHPEYLSALARIDSCVASAPDGLLPFGAQGLVRARCGDALDVLVFEARQLAIDISREGDQRLRSLVDDTETNRRNLVFRIAVLLAALAAVASYLGISRTRAIRRARSAVLSDARRLSEASLSLRRLESEMNNRIARETLLRAEDQRLDSAARMIATELRRATTVRHVVERLASGLEYLLKTDLIYIQVFGKGRESDVGCLIRDGRVSVIDSSQFGVDRDVADEIVQIVDQLEREGNTKVFKSTDVLRATSPALTAIIGRLSIPENSFVVGIREGNEVIGFVLVGREDLRSWNSNELGAVQNVVANSANAVGAIRSLELIREVRKTETVVSELRELDRMKNEFISNVNHELRTPLTSIIGYLEIIGDSTAGIPEETLAYLATVRRNADRLLELIENLLVVSRAEDPRNAVKKEDVDFAQIVDEVVGMVRNKDPQSRVKIEYDRGNAHAVMQGDRLRLTQIVVNLVTNAVKFSRDNSTVKVDIRIDQQMSDDAHVELRVVDSGIGIPADEIPHLFERFFRGSNAEKALIPGTGLGLPIVKQFVEDHQGTISVDSTENVGTTVTVRLPLVAQVR